MFFSYYTYDRTGFQLTNILCHYFYCYQNNLIYGGTIPKNKCRGNRKYYLRWIRDTKGLINFLGIPNNKPPINPKFSKEGNIRDLTNDFRDLLYNNVKPNLQPIKKNNSVLIVSIHVRRGDVSSNGRWSFRYTPDDYYFTLIEEIYKYKPDAKIYIFSEESFPKQSNYSRYRKLKCIFILGGPLVRPFNYFIQSDIFIMASSAFSFVPAYYRRNGLTISVPSKYFREFDDWTCGSIDDKKNAIQNFLKNF